MHIRGAEGMWGSFLEEVVREKKHTVQSGIMKG